MNLRKIFCVGISLVLALQLLIAQEVMDPVEGLVPAEMSSIDYADFPRLMNPDDLGFKIFAPSIGEEDLFIQYRSGDYRKIRTGSGDLSRTHYYPGSSPLVFYRKGLDEEGKVMFLPVTSCKFDASTKDLVICMAQRGAQYSLLPIDLSLKGQAMRSVRFVNFTPANLMVLLNDEKGKIGSGEEILTQFESKEKTYFNFKVGALHQGQAKMLYAKRQPFRGNTRILYIGYTSYSRAEGESSFRVMSHYDSGPEARSRPTTLFSPAPGQQLHDMAFKPNTSIASITP